MIFENPHVEHKGLKPPKGLEHKGFKTTQKRQVMMSQTIMHNNNDKIIHLAKLFYLLQFANNLLQEKMT